MKTFQDFRNEISIMQLATSIGYLQDVGKGHKWPVLINQFSKDVIIIVNPKSTSNQGYFNPNNDIDKGTLINFVKNRLGIEFKKDASLSESSNVNTVLYNFQNSPLPERGSFHQQQQHTTQQKTTKFSCKELTKSLSNYQYLLSRNLHSGLLFSKEFSGRIFNTNNNGQINIAFPYYDKDEKIVGIENKNYDYNQFTIGSERGRSVWHSNMPMILDKIIIAESVVDALSYHQINYSKNSLYVAIGGSLSKGQIEVIRNLRQQGNAGESFEYISAVDNDTTGLKYSSKLTDWLSPDKVVVEKPFSKDYNIDLGNLKNNIRNIKR